MRRLLLLLVATLAMPATANAATLGGWNQREQRAVAAAGVLPRLDDGRFHGERPLSGAQLTGALAALASRANQPAIAAGADATLTVTAFDARVVEQLGLADVAQHVQTVAGAAGLNPPKAFGTEVVARFLGLRDDHPPADEKLELYPWDAITRAEAAHSFAVVLQSGGWAVGNARAQLGALDLPQYSGSVRSALSLAASKIGMPYVWGGETDGVSFGQAHGGYDCSGFVWRVFGTGVVGGRTTAARYAGAIPKSERIKLDDVQPGDLLFFGRAHFNSKATEANIVHVGIALSAHWMIHDSAQGVYVSSLDDDWRRGEFAWARRVL